MKASVSVSQNTHNWSRLVKLLRIVGPIAIVGTILYIISWSYFTKIPYLHVIEDKLKKSNMLVNLKLISTDDQGKPVRISAQTAQDLGQGKAILNAPSSDFTTEDGTNMHLSANLGNLDKDNNSLTLEGSVDLKTKTGYELKAPSAVMNLKDHSTESFEPVYGKGLRGEIQSKDGIKITSDGDIFFKGNTTLTINASDEEQNPPQTKEQSE